MEAVGIVGEITLPRKEQGQVAFQLGARITAGRGVFHKTKILTLTPRYIVKNDLDLILEIEECDEQGKQLTEKENYHTTISAGNNVTFLFLSSFLLSSSN